MQARQGHANALATWGPLARVRAGAARSPPLPVLTIERTRMPIRGGVASREPVASEAARRNALYTESLARDVDAQEAGYPPTGQT